MSKNLTPKSKIEQLIEKLRSPDKSERKQAKTQLLASGSAATAPLLDLLIELAHHPYPRFQIGEEEDGEAALANYRAIEQQEGYFSDKLPALRKKIDASIINDRLATDILLLLGKLKAEAAVPLLIKIMEYQATNGHAYTEEGKALEAIGSAAIPCL